MQWDCINAVRLHRMVESVKGLREARVADTEQRIVAAAQRLFVRKGYQATTLAEVAEVAGVGERTVYVRFGTKAALLKRATDVAVAGDTRRVDVAHRGWFQAALTAATLEERIERLAEGTADLMRRAGDLFEAAQQAQASEPLLAEAMLAGRRATRRNLHTFVRTAVADGLVPGDPDVEWLAETVALAGQADTYLLLSRTNRWSVRRYQEWLMTTLHRLFEPTSATADD